MEGDVEPSRVCAVEIKVLGETREAKEAREPY